MSSRESLRGLRGTLELRTDALHVGRMDRFAPPYIDFQQVTVRYNEEVMALRNVSLQFSKGEFAFICGRTGSGKSTLLKLLTRDVRETSGKVLMGGRDLGKVSDFQVPALRRQMGIVPQDFALLPRKKVWENIAFAMRAVGATRKEARKRAPEILEQVRMAHRIDAFPHQLSGGEQQRVAIGRALIHNPKLILADEPTGNLDHEHSMEIIELLANLNKQGATVLIATHDLMVVDRTSARLVRLQDGRVVEDLKPEHRESLEQIVLPMDEAAPITVVTPSLFEAAEAMPDVAPPAVLALEPEPLIPAPDPPSFAEQPAEDEPADDIPGFLHPEPEPTLSPESPSAPPFLPMPGPTAEDQETEDEEPEDDEPENELQLIDEPLTPEVEIAAAQAAPVTLTREEILGLNPGITVPAPPETSDHLKDATISAPTGDGTISVKMPKRGDDA